MADFRRKRNTAFHFFTGEKRFGMKITIGIVDDHQLVLKSLCSLLESFGSFTVVLEALNGQQALEKLKLLSFPPDIVLVDVDMPVMNGFETVKTILKDYPASKTAALSMKEDDISIINMIKAGCCAYLLKDIHPTELEKALFQIYERGYYNADASNINIRRLLLKTEADDALQLTEKERQFLKLACSDKTYKQIAAEMNLSERTIDGYREVLFQKLNVQSRVGMAMEAIRLGVVSL
jgi:DNA-binding NarL/FixJ family response regulator